MQTVTDVRMHVRPKRKRSLSWGSTDQEKQLHDEEWQQIKETCHHYPPPQQKKKREEETINSDTQHQESPEKIETHRRKLSNQAEALARFYQIPKEHRIGDYLLMDQLGMGAGGSIYKAKNIKTGKERALKVISLTNKANKNAVQRGRREASVMAALNGHKRVVKFHGVIEETERFAIVMQLAEGRDLLEYILYEKKKRQRLGGGVGGLPRGEAWRLFTQMVEGLSYAHSRGFVHRDIKPENIFLDRCGNVLLGDWGYGSGWSPFRHKKKSCGSLNYVAPEILCGKKYIGPEVDIYALGVVMFAMLTGVLPFGSSPNKSELLKKIVKGDWAKMNPNLTALEVAMLDRMFDCNTLKRATMYDVVEFIRLYESSLKHPSTC